MWPAVTTWLGLLGLGLGQFHNLAAERNSASQAFVPALCKTGSCGHYQGVIEEEEGAIVHRSLLGESRHQRAYFVGSPGSRLIVYKEMGEGLQSVAATPPSISDDQVSMLVQCFAPGNYIWFVSRDPGSAGAYNVWLAREGGDIECDGDAPVAPDEVTSQTDDFSPLLSAIPVANRRIDGNTVQLSTNENKDGATSEFSANEQHDDFLPLSTDETVNDITFEISTKERPNDVIFPLSTNERKDEVVFPFSTNENKGNTVFPLAADGRMDDTFSVSTNDQYNYEADPLSFTSNNIPLGPYVEASLPVTEEPPAPFAVGEGSDRGEAQQGAQGPILSVGKMPMGLIRVNMVPLHEETPSTFLLDAPPRDGNFVPAANEMVQFSAPQPLAWGDSVVAENSASQPMGGDNFYQAMGPEEVVADNNFWVDIFSGNLIHDNQLDTPGTADTFRPPGISDTKLSFADSVSSSEDVTAWSVMLTEVTEDNGDGPIVHYDIIPVGNGDSTLSLPDDVSSSVGVEVGVAPVTQVVAPSVGMASVQSTSVEIVVVVTEVATVTVNAADVDDESDKDTVPGVASKEATHTTEHVAGAAVVLSGPVVTAHEGKLQHLTMAVIVTVLLFLTLLLLLCIVLCLVLRRRRQKCVLTTALDRPPLVHPKKAIRPRQGSDALHASTEFAPPWCLTPQMKRKTETENITGLSHFLDLDEAADEPNPPVIYKVSIPPRVVPSDLPPAYPVPMARAEEGSLCEGSGRHRDPCKTSRSSLPRREPVGDDGSDWQNVDLESQREK